MKENGGTFRCQAAEAKGNKRIAKTEHSESVCNNRVSKCRKDSNCVDTPTRYTRSRKYSVTCISVDKSRETEKDRYSPKISQKSRSSRDSSVLSNITSPSLQISTFYGTPCYKDEDLPILNKDSLYSLNNIKKDNNFDGIKAFGLKTKLEYLKCKQAFVYLEDCLKVQKGSKNRINKDCKKHKYTVTMKPVGSKSPKRHSPVRVSVSSPVTMDTTPVRTTYTKPGNKDTMIDENPSNESKAQCSSVQDDLVPNELAFTDSSKAKKKINVAMKKDLVEQEQTRNTKKRNPFGQGESVVKETDSAKSKNKIIDSGQGDFDSNNDKIDSEKTNSPKKRGRKPKSAETSPNKTERKISNSGSDTIATPDIVITPSKDDKKISKTPRSRKKKVDNGNSPDTSKQEDLSSSNEKLAVKKNSRLSSESPSPGRRKRSPKLLLEEKECQKSSRKGTNKKSKTEKIENECDVGDDIDESNQAVIDINDSHVDEVIEDVVSRNIEMLNKESLQKSSSKKNKKSESPGKKIISPNKEKKSPKKMSQDNETCSDEKKKPRSRSNSTSPKKEKKKLGLVPGDIDNKDSPALKKLDFDDPITKVMKEKSIMPFPSDFQYKYTSSGTGCLGLNDLISKVDSSVKNKDDNLTALFGKVETEYYAGESSPSSNETEVNTSTDSDKTIIEFEDVPEKSDKDEETSEGKDSEECADSSFDNEVTDTSENIDEVNNVKKKEDSNIDSNDKSENADGKSNQRLKESVNVENGNCDTGAESGNKINIVSDNENPIAEEKENVETVSLFEMFGLTLKKPTTNELKEDKVCDSVTLDKRKENSEIELEENERKCEKSEKEENIDEDVMFVSETKPSDNIVIVSDDDEEEHKGIDRSGFESLKESIEEKKLKPKLTTVNNVVEPKPLDILYKLERADSKKENAFTCNELDEYLDTNKENLGPSQKTQHSDNEINRKNEKKINVKEELQKAEPDFDEIDGHVFICFATESVLNAHISLEKKNDWLTEAQLRKMAHLKHMKERQHDAGTRRLTDVKYGDEHKQNFRGIPMRMMKYQKMLKQELEDMLLGRQPSSPDKSPSKTPTKTTDIRKIKGWKKKFQNQEEIHEATGLNISESGKVHWKTEERLVKNLDPEEIKDIGLDLKKKRRKLVNYSNKRKSGNDEKDAEMMEYEYEIDDLAIIESDVYNEDEDKPPPDKIPYMVKYSSQHKYGARKLFVKKMKLDAEDERILQKLGTQKQIGHKTEMANTGKQSKKGKQVFSLLKLTHTMAVAAVSALDRNLLKKAKGMDKTDNTRKTKREPRSARKETKAPVEPESPEIKEGVDLDNYEDDYHHNNMETEKEEHEEVKEEVKEEKEGRDDENEDGDLGENAPKKRRHSSACRGRNSRRSSVSTGADNVPEDLKVEIKREIVDTCTEPGCRYGCICHLCKFSDSGEEKETDFKPPCDKEYCRLGCICDSIDTKAADTEHCRKPGCMFKCKCPPKQPKPDIPREREHGKKKKGRGGKKKKRSPEKAESEQSGKEDDVGIVEDNDWEPPSKRKRGPTNSRFANLPKRETTYRLAKNLDAVSRKAMEVYASSEMFTEQKMRKRRSDPSYEDGFNMSSELKEPQERRRSIKQEPKSEHRLNEETGVLEISDEESDDEIFPEGLESCCRIQPYSGPYKRLDAIKKTDSSQLNKRKGGTGSKKLSESVIDLVDSDKEDNSGDNKNKSDLPSTSSGIRPQSLTEKMGLTNRLQKNPETEKEKKMDPKWKTQMVCLKAKKKSDDQMEDSQSEIKLLEIMSNCNWEIDRTNMLSKISHIISKEYTMDAFKSTFISWGAYLLEFLPKADKPAVIPPELKSRLPSEMYSIRIKVTNAESKEERAQKEDESVTVVETSEEEKKKYNMKLQKKLIDKIKFAERLRNQIILEERKGVTTSKFSVSREGIEKALKKYKTQLWKAYTGSSNFNIQQLKQALNNAKSSDANKHIQYGKPVAEAAGVSSPSLSASTLERIQSNQGVTVVTSSGDSGGHQSFINLSSLQQTVSSNSAPITSVGNIVIHGHISKPNPGKPAQAKGLIDNIENVKKFDSSLLPSGSKPYAGPIVASKVPIPKVSQSINTKLSSADVVLMPLDKNLHPSQLPPGTTVTFMQQFVNRDGSPVPFTVAQQSVPGAPIRVVLPSTSQVSSFPVVAPLLNPAATSLPCTRPLNPQHVQNPNPSGIHKNTTSSFITLPVQTSSVNGLFMNGSYQVVRPGIQQSQYVASANLPNTSTLPSLPLKNISNLGLVVSSENSGVTLSVSNAATVSPGTSNASTIKVNSDTQDNRTYLLPGKEMIGIPKVASVPFKLVPDAKGKPVLLVPATSAIMPSSTTTTLSVNETASPVIYSVPKSDKAGLQDTQEHAKSIYIPVMKNKNKSSDLKEKNSDENGLCKPRSNISDSNIAQEKNTSLDKEKTLDKSDNGNCIGFNVESETENCDKDSLASSTKSFASLSDLVKNDAEVDEKLNMLSSENISLNGENNEMKIAESIATDTTKLTKRATNEMSNSLEVLNKSDKESDDDFSYIENQKREKNLSVEKESIKNSECVVLDDSDEGSLVIDENYEPKERNETKVIDGEQSKKTETNNLSKTERKSPDTLNNIDWENEIKMMEDYMEKEQNDIYRSNSEENCNVKIEESEESDVDVTSYDVILEHYPDNSGFVLPGTSKPVSTSNKRKSQLTRMTHDDDFEIKRLKYSKDSPYPKTDIIIDGGCKKVKKEKVRRQMLRNLFCFTKKVVFKYNCTISAFQGKIPRHAILQEALNLITALKQREAFLMECLEDGRQYEKTLESQLKEQIDSFVDSGVPETIIKNFLKSVEKSVLPHFKRKKKFSGTEIAEEHDAFLDYEQLTPGKFQDIYLYGDNRLIGAPRSNEEGNNSFQTDSFPMGDKLKSWTEDIEITTGTRSLEMKTGTGDLEMKTGTGDLEMKTGPGAVEVQKRVTDKSCIPAVKTDASGNVEEVYFPSFNSVKDKSQLMKSNDAYSVSLLKTSVRRKSDTSNNSENTNVGNNSPDVGISTKSEDNVSCQGSFLADTSDSFKISKESINTNMRSIQTSGASKNIKSQDENLGFECDKPIIIEASPEKVHQKGRGTFSSSGILVTPGRKSSSDDDEIRSSTGDALMDHEINFINNDQWGETNQSENVLQINNTMV